MNYRTWGQVNKRRDLRAFSEKAYQRHSLPAYGLQPAEILARLERHASNGVPTNVLWEVREWSQWVRQVSSTTLTALSCPDPETADRVMAVLKHQAERINDTLVALDQKRITAAEQTKLRSHGVLIQGHIEGPESKPKARRER